jgi:hypothetical protein
LTLYFLNIYNEIKISFKGAEISPSADWSYIFEFFYKGCFSIHFIKPPSFEPGSCEYKTALVAKLDPSLISFELVQFINNFCFSASRNFRCHYNLSYFHFSLKELILLLVLFWKQTGAFHNNLFCISEVNFCSLKYQEIASEFLLLNFYCNIQLLLSIEPICYHVTPMLPGPLTSASVTLTSPDRLMCIAYLNSSLAFGI